MRQEDRFRALLAHYHTDTDSKGRAYVACPVCGKESKRTDVHFFFDEKCGKCFVCGAVVTLREMMQRAGLEESERPFPALPPPPPKQPIAEPDWKTNAEDWMLVYESAEERHKLWSAYKPLTDAEIDYYRMGYGPLPAHSSRCQHNRLILPLTCGSEIVGFRARHAGCECDERKTKWLSPSGTRVPLFNGAAMLSRDKHLAELLLGNNIRSNFRRRLVAIVENPIDAILFQRTTGWLSLATMGVSIWREEWTKTLREYRPEKVVIFYDNDLPGNGAPNERTALAWQEEWRTAHPGNQPPVPGGVRLANALLEAGVNASIYRWPSSLPRKYDIGQAIADGLNNLD